MTINKKSITQLMIPLKKKKILQMLDFRYKTLNYRIPGILHKQKIQVISHINITEPENIGNLQKEILTQLRDHNCAGLPVIKTANSINPNQIIERLIVKTRRASFFKLRKCNIWNTTSACNTKNRQNILSYLVHLLLAVFH